MTRNIVTIALMCSLLTGATMLAYPPFSAVQAEEDWKAEYEEICRKTADPMVLSQDELKSLIARCDKLKPRIAKMDESTAKVYLKRLQMCRDLYVFVLESKQNE